jgi:hypothetical protein
MRVLVVATPAQPALLRLTPTLATLAAQGAKIQAPAALSEELNREGVPHDPLEAAALDAAIRSLAPADLLVAPLGSGDVRESLAAITRALSMSANTPLTITSTPQMPQKSSR